MVFMRRIVLGVSWWALLAAAVGQVPTDTTVVLTETVGGPRSLLVAVSSAGAMTTFGRFPSDALPPLAVALDPIDRQVVVAVDLGGGTSRLLRLLPGAGTAFAGEVVLADVPGRCEQLSVAGEWLLAVVGGGSGGVYRLPRRGGSALRTVTLPQACALLAFGSSDVAIVLWSGATPTPSAPGLVHVDTATGQVLFGPFAFQNRIGARPTGLIDLPTALSRQLIAFADGTYWLHVGGLGDPTAVPMNPQPPPGGAVAFFPDGSSAFAGIAVGGAALPALYRADSSGNASLIAFPLPGAPVDFAPPLPAFPQVLPFGDACGPQPLQLVLGVMGPPQVGNTSFDVRVGNALPLQLAFFVAGADDVLGGALPLPVLGCPLHVSPDSIDFVVTNAGGLGIKTLPIPNVAALASAMLFAQWAQFTPGGLSASSAMAIQVGL